MAMLRVAGQKNGKRGYKWYRPLKTFKTEKEALVYKLKAIRDNPKLGYRHGSDPVSGELTVWALDKFVPRNSS